MKNIKRQLIFFVLVLATTHAVVIAKPLTIINATTSPMTVHVFVKSYKDPIEMTVYPGRKQAYEMKDLVFERMVWSTYGKKESADAFLLKKHVINVQEKMPTMVHGGTVVLSLGGQYMCDDKSGRRNAVKFGVGDTISNSTEKGRNNED